MRKILPKDALIDRSSAKTLLAHRHIRLPARIEYSRLSASIASTLSTVPQTDRRIVAGIIFLSLRVAYLSRVIDEFKGRKQAPSVIILSLIISAPQAESHRPTKKQKRSITDGSINPKGNNYDRDAHIKTILEEWTLGGFGFSDSAAGVATSRDLFESLCKAEFSIKRNRQLGSEPLPVDQISKVVAWFSRVFGGTGRHQLLTLVDDLKKSDQRSNNQIWSNACQLVQGRVHRPKELTDANRPGYQQVNNNEVTSINVPEGVKVLFQRLREYVAIATPTNRVAEVMRLDRGVQLLEFYDQCRRLLENNMRQISGYDQEQQRLLMEYLDATEGQGRNAVEKFHIRLFQDLSGSTDITPTKDDVTKLMKSILQSRPLHQLARTLGVGVYALVPAGTEKCWIKDFPESTITQVLQVVISTVPTARDVCSYLDSEVFQPLLKGEFHGSAQSVVEMAAKIFSGCDVALADHAVTVKTEHAETETRLRPASADDG